MASTQQTFLGGDFADERVASDPRTTTRARERASTADLWVQITLCVVVAALLLVVVGIPAPRPRAEAVVGEQAAYALKITLGELRAAIESFRLEHGLPPRELTTDRSSRISTPAHAPDHRLHADPFDQHVARNDVDAARSSGSPAERPFAPHFPGSFPTNTINGLATVRVLRPEQHWPIAADDTSGWMYQPATGEIRANSSGTVFGSEVRYFDL